MFYLQRYLNAQDCIYNNISAYEIALQFYTPDDLKQLKQKTHK